MDNRKWLRTALDGTGGQWTAMACHGMTYGYHAPTWHVMPCHAMSWLAMACDCMTCQGVPWYDMPCHGVPWHGLTCRVMACRGGMPRHGMGIPLAAVDGTTLWGPVSTAAGSSSGSPCRPRARSRFCSRSPLRRAGPSRLTCRFGSPVPTCPAVPFQGPSPRRV